MKHSNGYSMAAWMSLGLLLAFGDAAAAAIGPAHLLKDINQTLSYDSSSYPEQFHQVGNLTLFWARTLETGWELWRTDGTEAGTAFVKDIRPGPESGCRFYSSAEGEQPFDPAILNGEALFIANDGVHGWELWKSDGTASGTMMVKEIRPGPGGPFDDGSFGSGPRALSWAHVEAGGVIYFAADDGVHGFELWRSDGTEAGTFLLKDIRPGSPGLFGSHAYHTLNGFNAVEAGGSLFFGADDAVHGLELWKTDGTPAGTVLVKDIVQGSAGSDPGRMIELDGSLFFWAGTGSAAGPWTSDGTTAGTVKVRDFSSGSCSTPDRGVFKVERSILYTHAQYLCGIDGSSIGARRLYTFQGGGTELHGVFNGRLLMTAGGALTGNEPWASDGTVNGTVLLKDINPGTGSSYPASPLSVGGKLFFTADDGVHGREPWSSDGTEAGTSLILDLNPGVASNLVLFHTANDNCYLFASNDSGFRLWRSDGTGAGTRMIGSMSIASYDAGVAADGALLLSGRDSNGDVELWRSDGTDDGTLPVKDINPLIRTGHSGATFMGAITIPGEGDRMLFDAYDDVQGGELWMTDGTPQGTRLVKDIAPGPVSSISHPAFALVHGGALYFAAGDGVHGNELWKSDGTEAGTTLVADINPGSKGGIFSELVAFHGSMYFRANDGASGWEIWKSDGTAAGTVLAVETVPGPDSLDVYSFFPLGDTLYFISLSPSQEETLWKTDGSQAGTGIVKDSSLDGPLFPGGLKALGGKLFFTALDAYHEYEPWVSDGTEEGTHILMDIRPGFESSRPPEAPAVELGGFMFFAASDGVHGEDLWRTDGTGAGTVRITDLRPGSSNSGIGSMIVLDGTIYFTAGASGFHAQELWKSDGTPQETVLVRDDIGGFRDDLFTTAGGLIFTAWDVDHGYELWRSDGTSRGTVLAQDLSPGPRDSIPMNYAVMGDRVFFLADDLQAGFEPWVAHAAILLNQPARAIEDLFDEVQALDLPSGLSTSLTVKLDAAAKALARGRTVEAITALEVFGKHLDVLTPAWVPAEAATNLSEFVAEITGLLEATP